jgi:hypothetical protein
MQRYDLHVKYGWSCQILTSRLLNFLGILLKNISILNFMNICSMGAESNVYLWSYLSQLFLEWEMFQAEIVDKTKTRILCSITFFENYIVYEIMWKLYGTAGQATDDNVRHTHTASWIPKAKTTYSEYVMLITFSQQLLDVSYVVRTIPLLLIIRSQTYVNPKSGIDFCSHFPSSIWPEFLITHYDTSQIYYKMSLICNYRI